MLRRRCGIGWVQRSGWVDLVLGAVTAAFDHDGLDMVEQPIQQGCGQGGVVVEDLLPVFVGAIGGEDGGGLLVPGRQHLEEHVGTDLVDRQVADLVEDQDFDLGVATQLAVEPFLALGRIEVVEHLDGWHVEDAVSGLAGALAQGHGQVGLAQSDRAHEHHV